MNCVYKDYSVDGYNCQVTNLYIEDLSNAAIETVLGKHRPGKSNEQVAVLYIASSHSNCIKHIPTGVGNLFRNLKKLQVLEVPLTIISSIDFIGINSLRIVEIRKTFLTLLPEDTFNNLIALEILNLADNRIQELKSKTFRNLINLRKVLLAGNQMISLPSEIFVVNVQLEEIDLSSNRLKLVEDSIFDSLNSSTKISMADNFCIVKDSPLNVLREEIAEKCREGNRIVSETSWKTSQEELQQLKEMNRDLNTKLHRAYDDIRYVKKMYDELSQNFTEIDGDYNRILEERRNDCESTQQTSESPENVIKLPLSSSSLILIALLIILVVIVITLGFIVVKQRNIVEAHGQDSMSATQLTNFDMTH